MDGWTEFHIFFVQGQKLIRSVGHAPGGDETPHAFPVPEGGAAGGKGCRLLRLEAFEVC